VLQGVLGGLRVKLDTLNIQSESNWIAQTFAVLHACGAQVVLCLVASVFVATSRRWIECIPVCSDKAQSRIIIKVGIVLTACIFLQILAGAIMRHLNAGLVIPSFPYSTPSGDWLPMAWTFHVFINFAHRIGAILVCVTLIYFLIRLFKSKEHLSYLSIWTYVPIGLVLIQVYLGARITLRMLSEEHVVTTHALIGALILCSCWILTMFCFKINNVTLSHKEVEVSK
jgi:cytochrome c oxidase assembly protein subunit 15